MENDPAWVKAAEAFFVEEELNYDCSAPRAAVIVPHDHEWSNDDSEYDAAIDESVELWETLIDNFGLRCWDTHDLHAEGGVWGWGGGIWGDQILAMMQNVIMDSNGHCDNECNCHISVEEMMERFS